MDDELRTALASIVLSQTVTLRIVSRLLKDQEIVDDVDKYASNLDNFASLIMQREETDNDSST